MNASARSANRDDQRQQLAYVYFENEPSITHVVTALTERFCENSFVPREAMAEPHG
jgi:hypothetical protein